MVTTQDMGRRVRFRPFFITNPGLFLQGRLLAIMYSPAWGDDAIVEVEGGTATYNVATAQVFPMMNANGVPIDDQG